MDLQKPKSIREVPEYCWYRTQYYILCLAIWFYGLTIHPLSKFLKRRRAERILKKAGWAHIVNTKEQNGSK